MFTRVDQIEGQVDSGQPFTLPAPTGGLNFRDALDRMPAQDAVSLQNWVPDFDAVRVRKGIAPHTALTGFYLTTEAGENLVTEDGDFIVGAAFKGVGSLLAYQGFSSQGVLAFEEENIWDVSTSGSPTKIATNAANDDWVGTTFNDYLVMCNGENTPQYWDGATLSDSGFSSASLSDAANLVYVEAFNSRLYFVEKNTANLWYGSAGAVTGGTLELFDVGQVAQYGGYLQAVATWSSDGGEDLRDYLVLIMSTGEIIVYAGTNPSDANNWSRVASYKAAAVPLRRCAVKVGGELVIITREGLVPLSVLSKRGLLADVEADPIYGKIRRAVRDEVQNYSGYDGWFPHRSQTGELVVFNQPTKVNNQQTTHQWVLNSATGAWAEWTIPATAWASIDGTLYVAANGQIYRYEGSTDDGESISLQAETAFVRLRNSARRKQVTLIRPYLRLTQNENAAININVDYERKSFSTFDRTLSAAEIGARWDGVGWDEELWAPQVGVHQDYLMVGRTGVTFSVYMALTMSGTEYEWRGTDIVAQDGGIL